MPFHFAKTPAGDLFAANGMDPVLFWDGVSDQMLPAGVPKPEASVTVSGSGVGPILGTYSAYLRYLDNQGNVSSLSPLGGEYFTVGVTASTTISGTATTITNIYANPNTGYERRFFNGVNVPYDSLEGYARIVAASHGLRINDVVTISDVTGTTEVNGNFVVARVVNQNEIIINVRFVNGWTGGGVIGRATSVGGFTNATPIVLTSQNHGLVTGAKVKVTGIGTADGVYDIVVDGVNSFALIGSTGSTDIEGEQSAYVAGTGKAISGRWTSGVEEIVYSDLEVPTDPRVVRRQILRNKDGQTGTYYVDIDTDDLTSTSLTSTRSDDDLANQEEVPLFDPDLNPLANRYDEPPDHKPFMAHCNDRMFYWGYYDYSYGHVKVAAGSTSVTGVGTQLTTSLAGRFLYVVGATKPYEIDSVDVDTQIITLLEPYADDTDLYAIYAIQSPPGERRLVYYSEVGLPAAVPPLNSLEVQESGDDPSGAMVMGDSYIYLLERSHIHRISFLEDPGRDAKVFCKANRGCVNNRCWVAVERNAFMLDEQGVHVFSGDDEHISDPVQDIFRPDEDADFRISWTNSDYFHACYYPRQGVIRWFVTMSGERLPRHALAYEIRLNRWWIEEYPFPISASCVATNLPRANVLVGGEGRRVMSLWSELTMDGANADEGTVRGTVTSSTMTSLTDSGATFSSDLAGWPVVIVEGTGKGQTRIIASRTATALQLTQPWLILPDTTSVYQVGGISWRWKSSRRTWAELQQNAPRRIEVSFRPLDNDATFDLRLYNNYSGTPITWDADYASADHGGIKAVAQETDLVCDLTTEEGAVQQDMSGWRDLRGSGWRYLNVELKGVQNQEQVVIDGVIIEGAR